MINETDTKIRLIKYNEGNQQIQKDWHKSTGRIHFRYALMGIAVELFGVGK